MATILPRLRWLRCGSLKHQKHHKPCQVAWSKELRCPPGSAICGAQANLVKAGVKPGRPDNARRTPKIEASGPWAMVRMQKTAWVWQTCECTVAASMV